MRAKKMPKLVDRKFQFVTVDHAQRLVKIRKSIVENLERDLEQARLALIEAEHTLEQLSEGSKDL